MDSSQILRDLEANKSIIDMIPEPVILFASDGTVLLINSQTESLFGYNQNQIYKHNINEMLTTGDESSHNFPFTNMNINTPLIAYIHHKWGGGRKISVRLERVNAGVEKLTMAIIQLNVRASDRFPALHISDEHSLNIDTKLLDFLAHELRSPLTSIVGFTGTLLMQLSGPLNPDQIEQLHIIKASANLLLKEINDSIEVAKIDLCVIEPRIEIFSCHEIIKKLHSVLEAQAKAHEIELIYEKSTEDIMLNSDKKLLYTILDKLVDNAIKNSNVTPVIIKIYRNVDNNTVHIAVHDKGVGIPKAQMSNLFKPLTKIHTKEHTYEGLGLGLYIAKKLSALINGNITCESTQDNGTIFTVNLKNAEV